MTAGRPLWKCIVTAPLPHDRDQAGRAFAELSERIAADVELAPLAEVVAEPAVRSLLDGIFGNSPFLTGLAIRQPARLLRCLSLTVEQHADWLRQRLWSELGDLSAVAPAMKPLREFKTEAALAIGIADIAGVMPIMAATAALSTVADDALAAAIRVLANRSALAADLLPDDPAAPERSLGYIVIGMGKHGARELNYSSDIDLIIFYDLASARLAARVEPQSFYVRLTRDLLRLMQERTGDGYVFRTDLRLRPDPGATQVALSTEVALQYYESFGQNWERAALIKARPVAGDIAAGSRLLTELAPYIWRKYLDFAAIADIHAMKRQIHAFRGFGEVAIAGHNIKLGRGGIREIEFFAQTQQLIAGGRQRDLRVGGTLEALDLLARRGWITDSATDDLGECYRFLRMVEHRLQMILDEQTQTLPAEPEKLLHLARFCGFADYAAFAARLTEVLTRVQRHYGRLFEDTPELTTAGGNLVFTGDEDDPDTLETLRRLGFDNPSGASATIRGWHRGRYPAMRSARARELLTEFHPRLFESLAATAEPDLALSMFDRFLSELPAGVQLFSLLKSNPSLVRLLADIMGTAPRLARQLGRRSRLLDAVLDPGFFGAEPPAELLRQRIAEELGVARDLQELLDRARVVGNEQAFLIGVRILSGTIAARRAGLAYALLAETLITALAAATFGELERVHGRIPGASAAIVAMGKLGGSEMTTTSDLDLIVIYDYPEEMPQSDGAKPLAGPQYFARATQRLITAITASTAEGRLYEVDMRLRPSGNKGPVATHIDGFVAYQNEAAWTWEHLALTRARVLGPPTPLKLRIENNIRSVLTARREPAKLKADVADMRRLVEAEKGTDGIWNLKQVRGGQLDIEFIAQYLQLRHAAEHPSVLSTNTAEAFERLEQAGVLAADAAATLIAAVRLYDSLSQILRLCFDGPFLPEMAPSGLRKLLAAAAEVPDFVRLEAMLAASQQEVRALFAAFFD